MLERVGQERERVYVDGEMVAREFMKMVAREFTSAHIFWDLRGKVTSMHVIWMVVYCARVREIKIKQESEYQRSARVHTQCKRDPDRRMHRVCNVLCMKRNGQPAPLCILSTGRQPLDTCR